MSTLTWFDDDKFLYEGGIFSVLKDSDYRDESSLRFIRAKRTEEQRQQIETLKIHKSVQALPREFFKGHPNLLEVSLPDGSQLTSIGNSAFAGCPNLEKFNQLPPTVKSIGQFAFLGCENLKKFEFKEADDDFMGEPSQLELIDEGAFEKCESLQRIEPPPSLTTLGPSAFDTCIRLKVANLWKTKITKLAREVLAGCCSLQIVWLPESLESVEDEACCECKNLETVIVQSNSNAMHIGKLAFDGCKLLANFALPEGSTAQGDSFEGCITLFTCFETKSATDIVARLVGRFDDCPVNKLCYHPTTKPQRLRDCIEEQLASMGVHQDTFGMNPFHILFMTLDPNMKLLQVLLELLPHEMLHAMLSQKDVHDKLPLEYLIKNRTNESRRLLQTCLKTWMVVPLVARHGNNAKCVKFVKRKVEELLAEHDHKQRLALFQKLHATFDKYRW